MKNTPAYLQKLEQLLKVLQFKLRYEKGGFKPGACTIENQRVIVINKYFDTPSRIQAIIEVMQQTPITPTADLDANSRKLLSEIMQTKIEV